MTYTDLSLRVSNAQAVTGTEVSDSSIDLQTVDASGAVEVGSPDLGLGEQLVAQVHATTDFATSTAMKIEIILASDALLTSDVVVIGSTDAIPTARVNDGEPILVRMNPNPENTDLTAATGRYLGLRYTPTGTPSAGAFTSYFVHCPQGPQRHYPTRYEIN